MGSFALSSVSGNDKHQKDWGIILFIVKEESCPFCEATRAPGEENEQ